METTLSKLDIRPEDGKPVGSHDAGRYWHFDLCYLNTPSRVTLLNALEVPSRDGEVFGDTRFASAAAAYDAQLLEPFGHLAYSAFRYRHKWRFGDLLMWDNCAVQHKATSDFELPLRRLMQRCTFEGAAPVAGHG